MDLTHRFTVPAPLDEAWSTFNDLERVAPCFPGAALTSYDGRQFAGLVKVKLGPISLQYTGTGSFVERDESAHRAVIEAKGKDKRGNGTAAATVTTRLIARDDGATDVEVLTALNITGKPAQFGRGVMQEVGDKLLGQFVACLETLLIGGGQPEPEPTAQAPANEEASEATTPPPPAKKAAAKKSAKKAAPAAKKAAPASAAKKTSASAAKKAAAEPAAQPVVEPVVEPAGEPLVEPAGEPLVEPAAPTGPPQEPSEQSDAPFTSAFHEPVALDLGRTMLPILAKRLGPVVLALAGALVLWRLARRR